MRHDQDPMEECAEFLLVAISIFAGIMLFMVLVGITIQLIFS